MSRGWKRLLKITGVVVLLFVAFVGFAHTKWGRPMLGMLSGVPGCPEGFGGGDPTAVEEMRKASVVARSTPTPSATHPALMRADGRALELGKTTRAEVTAWLGKVIDGCKSVRDGQVVQCENPAVELDGPAVGDLHFQFVGDVLVAVDVFRANSDPHSAVGHLQQLSAAIAQHVGPATKTHGTLDAAWVGGAPLRQTSMHYNYKGYVAELSITNMGPRGVRLREQYQWAAM